ncbi:hypothetical protein [Terrabacter sp. 2YAF2]|uniref:hypothetical protein n=1 Tax=Terrabacter sp. 2YAF2 TaxID=3233026 RepID=UPI003F996DD3
MPRAKTSQLFTVQGDATDSEVASVCRAARRALWEDLAWLEVDLAGLDDDLDCAEAVAALYPLRKRHWLSKQLHSVAHLVPGRDDDKRSAVMPLLSRTIYSAGLSRHDGHMVFNADDRGTSCVFELTAEQLARLQGSLLAEGKRVDVLIPWRSR